MHVGKVLFWFAHFKNGTVLSERQIKWVDLKNKELIEKIGICNALTNALHIYDIPANCRPFILNDAVVFLGAQASQILGMAAGALLNKRGDYRYIYVPLRGQPISGRNNFLKPKHPFDFPPQLNLNAQGVKIDELPN